MLLVYTSLNQLYSVTVTENVALLAEDYPDTQVMVWDADNNARQERYCIHLTKSHTLQFVSRAKKRETEPDIFMAGERVDTPDTTVQMGIVRNTNGRADIDGKISLGRKTAYSLMGAGLHGGGRLKATLDGHIWSTFVIPRLLYGLEALLLKQKDIDSLEKFQRKCLKQIQGISSSSSNIVHGLL